MQGSRARPVPRRGVTLVEVLIVAAILGVILLFLLMAIPQSRETARLAGCENNLMKIGQVAAHYDTAAGHLPAVPPAGQTGPGPLALMLGQFGLGDLQIVVQKEAKWVWNPEGTTNEHLVRDFLCPADSRAMRGGFPAPVSYRGNAGPAPDGQGGPFAFGQSTTMDQVEQSAGGDYTAGFAERLVGSGKASWSVGNDYLEQPGTVGDSCGENSSGVRKTDAGHSWAEANWTSTLYSHAMVPNAGPSCVSRDGRTARMGASSAHQGRVNVLMLSGAVRGFSPSVDPGVWRKFAGVLPGDRGQTPTAQPAP